MSQGVPFRSGAKAVDKITRIYNEETGRIKEAYQALLDGEEIKDPVIAHYPQASIVIERPPELDTIGTQSYGFCVWPGLYQTTVTRPDILGDYYADQFDRLIHNHDVAVYIGESDMEIPASFVVNSEANAIKGKLTPEQARSFYHIFRQPKVEDYESEPGYVNGPDSEYRLFWHNGPMVDEALGKLKHYTGTNPRFFQNYILFTNYGDYIEEFKAVAQSEMQEGENYIAFVEPGDRVTLNEKVADARHHFDTVRGVKPPRDPQMPAYHLVRQDGSGVSIVNIGVGPSNASNITDKIAVLRPHAWLMVGHCAGLNYTQRIGDYVLPNGFVLEEGLKEKEMAGIDLPELSEIHRAIKDAAKTILNVEGEDYRRSIRTGIITTVADRNWEIAKTRAARLALYEKFGRNRSIALEMETGTIAANGFEEHIPYGALLCVSDRPLHGEPKLPHLANEFYRSRVREQFKIAMEAIENIRNMGDSVHSRKMRSDYEFCPAR